MNFKKNCSQEYLTGLNAFAQKKLTCEPPTHIYINIATLDTNAPGNMLHFGIFMPPPILQATTKTEMLPTSVKIIA
jgi:hypothetical protein